MAHLKARADVLKVWWHAEKDAIRRLSAPRKQIEQTKIESEPAERQDDCHRPEQIWPWGVGPRSSARTMVSVRVSHDDRGGDRKIDHNREQILDHRGQGSTAENRVEPQTV